jgi:hypothetical protein
MLSNLSYLTMANLTRPKSVLSDMEALYRKNHPFQELPGDLARIRVPAAYVDAKAVRETESNGSTVNFFVVGNPVGGPDFLNGKDLYHEFFDNDTDYGRMIEVRNYYDHAWNSSFGAMEFGRAIPVRMEPNVGLIYRIELEKSNEYHEMLKELADMKALFVSSQPVQSTVLTDYPLGKIIRWHNAEISFTVRPANPKAEVALELDKIVKKFIGEGDFQVAVKKAKDAPVAVESVQEVVAQVEPVGTSLLEGLAEGLGVTQAETAMEDATVKTISDTLVALNSNFIAFNTNFEAKFAVLEENVALVLDQVATTEDLAEAFKYIGDLRGELAEAMKTVGKMFAAKTVEGALNIVTQASPGELSAIRARNLNVTPASVGGTEVVGQAPVAVGQQTVTRYRSASKLPSNAPGANLK